MFRSFATASTLFVLAAASVGAQPVTRPEMRAEMCGVTFVRAPDDVRYVIEQWLRAEPRCSSSIELRVVPTDGGFYLLAQRPDGRIHERFVPDAQSAGVLVASWVADDWTAPDRPALAPEPPPVIPVVQTVSDEPRGAPGAVGVIAVARPRAHHSGKWLSLGAVVMPNPDEGGGGFRGEADLMTLGSWKLGGVISYTESNYNLAMSSGNWDFGYLTADDLKVMATLSRSWTWGRWELRGGLGIGAVYTDAHVDGRVSTAFSDPNGGYQSGSSETTKAAVEISGLVTRRLGTSWGIGLGPVITLGDPEVSSTGVSEYVERTVPNVMVFGGLRYEL